MLARADTDDLVVLLGIPGIKNFEDACLFNLGVMDRHCANQFSIAAVGSDVKDAILDLDIAWLSKKKHVLHFAPPHSPNLPAITNDDVLPLAVCSA